MYVKKKKLLKLGSFVNINENGKTCFTKHLKLTEQYLHCFKIVNIIFIFSSLFIFFFYCFDPNIIAQKINSPLTIPSNAVPHNYLSLRNDNRIDVSFANESFTKYLR